MDLQRLEIKSIAEDPREPTFENTLGALERSGAVLRRVYTVYGIHSSSLSDPSIQNIEKIWEPKLAAFQDEITQNDALFQRIGTVYQNRDTADLTPEQRRLLTVVYQGFVRAGANLSEDDKGGSLRSTNAWLCCLHNSVKTSSRRKNTISPFWQIPVTWRDCHRTLSRLQPRPPTLLDMRASGLF